MTSSIFAMGETKNTAGVVAFPPSPPPVSGLLFSLSYFFSVETQTIPSEISPAPGAAAQYPLPGCCCEWYVSVWWVVFKE
jgi:hypothetical protein